MGHLRGNYCCFLLSLSLSHLCTITLILRSGINSSGYLSQQLKEAVIGRGASGFDLGTEVIGDQTQGSED
jgi:hypothetical protein